MKLLISILVSLLVVAPILGQQATFEYLQKNRNDASLEDIAESYNGDIYFLSRYSTPESPLKKMGFIGKLNQQGQLIDSTVFSIENKSAYFTQIHLSPDGEHTLTGLYHDTLHPGFNAGFILMKMDDMLNLSNPEYYALPTNYHVRELFSSKNDDETITLYGGLYVDASSTDRPFIYEFNNNFDSIIAKVFFGAQENGLLTQVKKRPDDNYWALKILRWQYELLDADLNLVEAYPLPWSISGHIHTKWDSDTSFYLLGKGMFPLPVHNLSFVRQFHPYDTTGHLYQEWRPSDTVDYPATLQGIDFKTNDSIYIGGSRNVWIGNYNAWPSWFVMLQTDSLLNIRWERFYGGDAYYWMRKLVATTDGGCLVAGIRYDYQNTVEQQTDIIILKLNNKGQLVSINEQAAVQPSDAIVYPNPGTNEILVRIGSQHKRSLFSLFDLNGKLVLQKILEGKNGRIEVSALDRGTYLYTISNQNGLDESGKWIKM